MLYDNRTTMINAFVTRDIIFEDVEEDVYQDEEPKYEETTAKRTKMRRQKQEGKRVKILTPRQMLSRLPIYLTQLKAGKNSQKLKSEIRQLLQSLYRSKDLSKTIYKHLMNTI